jgi:hypothetical protein
LSPPRITNYSHREVKHLVRSISAMAELKDHKDVHVKVIDFDRAFQILTERWRDEARAVYVCGVYQVDFRDAEQLLHYSRTTIHTWYLAGLKKLVQILNGELL